MLFDELASGKFDSLAIAVDEVRGAGKFNGSMLMADSKGDFLGKEAGIWCNNGGAYDIMIAISKELDEAVV